MALQVAIPYVITGPDGTRAVLNDASDPDFVGFLDPENGISDGLEVRENADNLVEDDGGIHGSFYYGRRPIVLQGIIWPDPITLANQRMDKLARATNAMRDDCTLRWTEDGSVEKLLYLRRQTPPRFTGRRPKQFQVGLVSKDSRIVSAAEQAQLIGAVGTVTLGGLEFPLAWPINFGGGEGIGSETIVNLGNTNARPAFRVDGPITNPVIANDSTGEELRLNYTLNTGEYLEIDSVARSIRLAGTDDRYYALDFANSTWWQLRPGANTVRLRATAYATPAALTVSWRHSFIS